MESCAPLLLPDDRRAILFDIGGGSTEIVWVRTLPGVRPGEVTASLIGTSGTVTTLAGVALSLPRYRRTLVDGRTIDIDAADQAMGDLFALGRAGLAAHPCVGPERVDFVLPGCAVYAAIRRVWPVHTLTVADRGLREGMLLRMIRADRPGCRRA